MKRIFLTILYSIILASAYCKPNDRESELDSETKVYPSDKDKEFNQGSGINQISLNSNNTEMLKHLGLIWGFLKYHHPNIAKGNYNWDYELFRILPQLLSSKNQKETNKILTNWINDLGTFSVGKEADLTSTDIKLKPDLDWITNSGLSAELSAALLKIKKAKRPYQHHYIGLNIHTGYPEFKNENAYDAMRYPDAAYRLLALYRYWNIIQYYFPYKNLIEEDWKKVLEEFIPKIIESNNETEYTLSVLELIVRVHDSHAGIWKQNEALSHFFGKNLAPYELRFVENKAVIIGCKVEMPGNEHALKVGDVLTKINNRSINEIVQALLKYTPGSNYTARLRDMTYHLLATNDTVINVEFIRNEQKNSASLSAYSREELKKNYKAPTSDTCFKFIAPDIGYIHNGTVKSDYLYEIFKHLNNNKGLIIDCRNYPSDFVVYEMCKYLMPDSRPFVKFSTGSIETPGLFRYERTNVAGRKNLSFYDGKVVILVDERTQSSAEFHALAYRVNPNAIVIGSTTAGADGNVSEFQLPGGISTMISGIGVYYPDGRETQRIGIVPDIEVKPSLKGILKAEDEVLQKAIDIINSK